MSYLFPETHRRLAIFWLVVSAMGCLIAGVTGLGIRLELAEPGLQFIQKIKPWGAFVGGHGFIALFFGGLPCFLGAAPHILLRGSNLLKNNPLSWLASLGAFISLIALFLAMSSIVAGIEQQAADTGWTVYAPLVVETDTIANADLLLASLLLLATGLSLNGCVCLIESLRLIRRRETLGLPALVILIFLTAFLGSAPYMIGLLRLFFLDPYVGMSFFDPAVSSDPVLITHLLWQLGALSEYWIFLLFFVVALAVAFSFLDPPNRGNWKNALLLGLLPTAVALVFSVLGFLGLALLASGVVSLAIILYVQLQCFRLQREAHLGLLWLSPLPLIVAFATSGIYALTQLGELLHDTYYVVAHLHYAVGFPVLLVVVGLAWQFLASRKPQRTLLYLGSAHFWVTFFGFNLAYLPQYWLGFIGMPRRYGDYPDAFETLNAVSSLATYFMLAGFLVPLTAGWIWFRNRASDS